MIVELHELSPARLVEANLVDFARDLGTDRDDFLAGMARSGFYGPMATPMIAAEIRRRAALEAD